MEFEKLLGKTIIKIEVNDDKDRIEFTDSEGERYAMYHSQDCCESVTIDDINGDLNDLIGSPISLAEESFNNEEIINGKPAYPDSFTWTFYKLATVKGYVDIRWLGESNGYYSESAEFVKL